MNPETSKFKMGCDCGIRWFLCKNLRQRNRQRSKNKDPPKCRFCPQLFKSAGNLKVHERTVHTGERPFECNTCSARFKTKRNLRHHLATHSNIKPFKCQF